MYIRFAASRRNNIGSVFGQSHGKGAADTGRPAKNHGNARRKVE
jgi:hypothetical protein